MLIRWKHENNFEYSLWNNRWWDDEKPWITCVFVLWFLIRMMKWTTLMLYTLKNNGLIMDLGEIRGFWGERDEKKWFYDSWKSVSYVLVVFVNTSYKLYSIIWAHVCMKLENKSQVV